MLAGCLESLEGKVDRIVVVDGAMADFPYEEPVSTDSTRMIAEAFGVEWIDAPEDEEGYPRAWATEVEKRTATLVGEEGDWYLQIDADERLVGRLPKLESGQYYAIWLQDARASGAWSDPVWAVRVFEHRGRMRYEGAHCAVWSDGRLMRRETAVRVPREQCRILHLAHLRSKKQQAQKRVFREKRRRREAAYRRAHGI